MQDNAMQAHDVRITAIEKRQDRLDDALERLATDMHRLAIASVQQSEDREALKRAFVEIQILSGKFDGLEAQIRMNREQLLQSQANRAENELTQAKNIRARVVWTAVSYLIAGAIGALFAHFGITMIAR